MKINDLRTLIREEIQNELAEAKKKKKKEAKEKIMEIIAEAELTEVELEEGIKDFFSSSKKGDPAEITKLFPNDEALAKELYRFYGQKYDDKQKEIALSNLKDEEDGEKKKKKLIQGLANLGLAVGYGNIKNYKLGSKFKDEKGKEIALTQAYVTDTLKVPQFGEIISAATKAGDRSIGSGGYGE